MPRKILILVCMTIVRRSRPDWLAVSVQDAARELDINPQRISRLSSRAQEGFEKTLAPLVSRGRPVEDRVDGFLTLRLAVTEALLGIASALLAHISWRKPVVKAFVVGAYQRLRKEHPGLTQKVFCEGLALSSRTLREWLAHPEKTSFSPANPIAASPPASSPRKRPPRRPRFTFDRVLPATQLAGDTTDLSAFDCPLKLVATQDVGGRDEDLLESIIVDDHESADLVVQAFTEAIDGREGFQAIVDQGTPYMAQQTRDGLDALGTEFAPQVEGTPTDKATMERAFGSVKSFARPLLDVTDRIAEKVPALRNTKLAIALTTLLLTALLKAYQAGAREQRRAAEQRGGICRDDLLEAAREHREQSRAEDRSRLLLLRFIHDAYDIQRPVTRFVRSLRRFPLVVIRRAERAFGTQVHRDDIRDRASYFIAIVRRMHDDYCAEQSRRRAEREQQEQALARNAEHVARLQAWHETPSLWLREALDALAAQWQPCSQQLLYGGAGLARRWLNDSLTLLAERNGPGAASDIARGVFRSFAAVALDHIGEDGVAAVSAVLDQYLTPLPQEPEPSPCTQGFVAAILARAGLETRPAPKGSLSNLPARPGGS